MTIGYRGDRDLGFDFVLFCSAFVVFSTDCCVDLKEDGD